MNSTITRNNYCNQFYQFISKILSTYLGQNFLTDTSILQRIVTTIDNLVTANAISVIVEIGPGKGALTKRIVGLGPRLICIEKDTTMQQYLSLLCGQHAHMSVVFQDVLEVDSEKMEVENPGESLIVGNLPYYITSPILRKFFGSTKAQRAGGVFLIQKEVAEKIVHNAPKKSFLRWMINYAYHVEYCFSVPPKAFNPPPKVTSAVIRLIPKDECNIPNLHYQQMIEFLDQYSPYKRKTLGASHKIVQKLSGRSKQKWTEFDISIYSKKRLEELGREEMKHIISTP